MHPLREYALLLAKMHIFFMSLSFSHCGADKEPGVATMPEPGCRADLKCPPLNSLLDSFGTQLRSSFQERRQPLFTSIWRVLMTSGPQSPCYPSTPHEHVLTVLISLVIPTRTAHGVLLTAL